MVDPGMFEDSADLLRPIVEAAAAQVGLRLSGGEPRPDQCQDGFDQVNAMGEHPLFKFRNLKFRAILWIRHFWILPRPKNPPLHIADRSEVVPRAHDEAPYRHLDRLANAENAIGIHS